MPKQTRYDLWRLEVRRGFMAMFAARCVDGNGQASTRPTKGASDPGVGRQEVWRF